jgi:hypothetical protein
MKETKGKGNPAKINEYILEYIKEM